MEPADKYAKLRPETATSSHEICRCQDTPPIALQDHLSPVPLACARCNGEIPPEWLGFTNDTSELVACWRDLHRALYTLWLDSADYEAWAHAQLSDPDGQVNTLGLQVVAELNEFRRAYLWWFQDESAENFVPVSECPRCRTRLSETVDHWVCEGCSILIPSCRRDG